MRIILAASNAALVDLLLRAKDAYYNTDTYLPLTKADKLLVQRVLGVSAVPDKMSDSLFDTLEDALREVAPKDPYFKKIGAVVRAGKVKLPYPMPSLDQLKTDDAIESWYEDNEAESYVVEDKLDSVSIGIVYEQGGKIKAYTRGDGNTGQDISHLVPFLNLPPTCPFKAIRGEIIMEKARFERSYSEAFENPRNMVSGLVNAKKVHEAFGSSHIQVVFYGVLDSTGIPSQQLKRLKAAGFAVVPFQEIDADDLTTEWLSAYLEKRRASSKYEIDGLVVVRNAMNRAVGSGNPTWAFKFKTTSKEATAKTTVTGVEWNASKHGAIKPVVLVKPVRVAGVTVSRATGHNAKFIYDNKIGPGASIVIERRGDVIPYVAEVVRGTKPQMPDSAGYEWKWDSTKVNAVLVQGSATDEVKIKRLVNFFRVLGAENVSSGLISRAYEGGYTTPSKILRMTKRDWMKLPGFQSALAERSYQAVQDSVSAVDPTLLADATGLLGPGFGQTRFAALLELYPDALTTWGKLTPDEIYDLAIEVPGLGDILAEQVAQGFGRLLKWLASVPEIRLTKPPKIKKTSNKLDGQSITFTGWRDADLVEKITKAGGQYVDFGSKTTILVYGGRPSSKVDKAKAKGIDVMSVDQFLSYLKKLGV